MIPNLPRNVVVTGGAGFLGSHVVDRLLQHGHSVTVYDNFSTGQREFIADASASDSFKLIEGDLLDLPKMTQAFEGAEFVFHFAANADIRFGLEHPRKDMEQNTVGTMNVLEAMLANGTKRIAFASTSAAIGEPTVFPTPEGLSCPIQTSLYGASKMAGEGLVSSFCEGFGFEGYIFRFVSLVGERYPHGHVIDFVKQLLADPSKLKILGDGKQKKSYMHVEDCVNGILHVTSEQTAIGAPHNVQVYNLGSDDYCELIDSIGWICDEMKLDPELIYTGGERGWIGDSPYVFLDNSKLRATGWEPNDTIESAIRRTVVWLCQNKWVIERCA